MNSDTSYIISQELKCKNWNRYLSNWILIFEKVNRKSRVFYSLLYLYIHLFLQGTLQNNIGVYYKDTKWNFDLTRILVVFYREYKKRYSFNSSRITRARDNLDQKNTATFQSDLFKRTVFLSGSAMARAREITRKKNARKPIEQPVFSIAIVTKLGWHRRNSFDSQQTPTLFH